MSIFIKHILGFSFKGVFTVLLLFLYALGYGQQEVVETSKPLKVGLVLSGGGAKGLAHIGVLKVIEDTGVKIDYIAGTSMGAIVGALYASGYKAKALDSLFRVIDFNRLIQDNFPRANKTFYEKEDAERYAISLPFDGNKISFPQAISGGQNVYNKLLSLLYNVKDIKDFNALPIPFFCMATDVEKGIPVLLNSGYLPEAIMASGTFPSLFEPVELNGQLLIDGGVLNNYPIAELKALGANFIIGVDVQHDLAERESLGSATDILMQINNFRTVAAMTAKAAMTDIYIKPEISAYTVVSFDKAQEIVATGETAAMKHYKALTQLYKRQEGVINKNQPPMGAKDFFNKGVKTPPNPLKISEIVVNGIQNYSDNYIKGKLRFKQGDNITFEDLERGINNIAATNNFKTIRYRLEEKPYGLGLVLNLSENENKTNIRFGAHYDGLYKSAALVNITKKNFLRKDDVASLDFMFGDFLRYQFDYYVDKGFNWSFGMSSRLHDFDFDIPYEVLQKNFRTVADNNLNNVTVDFTDLTNQVYLQTVYRNAFSLALGAEHKWLMYSSSNLQIQDIESGTTEDLVLEQSHYASVYANLKFDTLDHFFFPKSGFYFSMDFHSYLLSSDFNGTFNEFSIFRAKTTAAIAFSKKWSLVLAPEVGIKTGSSGTKSLDFALGGFGAPLINNFIPFLGYDFISIPGDSFLKGKATLDFEVANKNHFILAANIAKVTDDILKPGSFSSAPSYFGYGIGYGLESLIGPIQVMYTKAPLNGSGGLFFSVGFPF